MAIEGFKGFAPRKSIDVRGRHTFLLGDNGNGKSSIVEAVRWGLFGSTNRQGEIVINRGYPGQCCVEIDLTRDDQSLTLRRTLPRGTSRSSPRLADEHGNPLSIKDVMPQLDSVEAGEGTHVIFAPQSIPQQRLPQDLSAFERTLFNHLGLSNARGLLSILDEFLAEQEDYEVKFGGDLDTLKNKLDEELNYTNRRRAEILRSPPWIDQQTPTQLSTAEKITSFIRTVNREHAKPDHGHLNLDALLDVAENSISRTSNRNDLNHELDECVGLLRTLDAIKTSMSIIGALNAELSQTNCNLESALSGASTDDLNAEIAGLQNQIESEEITRIIARNASELLRRTDSQNLTCPLCDTDFLSSKLRMKVEMRTEQSKNEETTSALRNFEERLKSAEASAATAKRLQNNVDRERADLDRHAPALRSKYDLGTDYCRVPDLHYEIENRRKEVVAKIESFDDWQGQRQRQLDEMRTEARFHTLQRTIRELEGSKSLLDAAQAQLDDLVAFGASLQSLRNVMDECITESLRASLPNVSSELTRVFSALTRHPHFDTLLIDETKLPRLELQVASSHDRFSVGYTTDVLNGQAESALRLVPYFSFSQDQDAPTEVYLVLLDDPTRAFDETHTSELVAQLASLGRHVQLFVASQETTRFRDLLPKFFAEDEYVVIEPRNWTYEAGPELTVEFPDD